MSKAKTGDRQRAPRGQALRHRGDHVNSIGGALQTDVQGLEADIEPDLRLDTEDLINRGILTRDGLNPDSGIPYLEAIGAIKKVARETRYIRGHNRGDYVYIPAELCGYLTAIMAGRSRRGQKVVWREMLFVFGKARLALIEVKNPAAKKIWYGAFAACDISLGSETLLHLICADPANRMSYDFASQGSGQFELKVAGLFPSLENCLDYRDYSINAALDRGWTSYNMNELEAGGVKRYVTVEMPLAVVDWFSRAVAAKRFKVKDLLLKMVTSWLRSTGVPEIDPEMEDLIPGSRE
jgi:hypothetical protein